MGNRRRARETALQLLYGLEYQKEGLEVARSRFWESFEQGHDVQEFTDKLVTGVSEHQDAIDETIQQASTNWRLERMAVVDRNILRLATYELRYATEIPPKVTLNEAIEIGKRFGGEESGAFINGILDRISNEDL